ncbi:ABC transporter permease [Cohnella silvisoli]|uniref:ABC transporter permease n=1 Tax=Cohnella silvisoli TaxID=2873699 RepID=A0ABV1KTP1_9BACL|nr:ABC transporter permease [Cohnella silvisoli]MCD9021416.1 ABC transporter permease [Cohnella silvisoli]
MILNIAKKEWKLLLKEKGTFFWLLGMPIMFIVLFGSVFGIASSSSVTLPYIDMDHTPTSQSFLKTVGDKSGYKLEAHQSEGMQDQIDKIRDGKGTALLIIPQGFEQSVKKGDGNPISLELYREATSDSVIAPFRAVLENLANGYRETKINNALAESGQTKEAREQVLAAPFTIKDRMENGSGYNVITQVVPGYTVMFVFFVIISMLKRFLGDKESGMTARLRSTRMSPMSYLLGMWLSYLVITLIQCTVLLTFGHLVYDLQLGDLFAICVLVFMLAVCGTGIGLAISMLVRSDNQGMAFTQLLTMGGAVLGGLWFPVDLMPKTIQTISHFTPQYWAQKAFQDIMLRGVHISGIVNSLLVLAIIAALGLIVALVRYKRFLRTALG